MAPQRVVLMSCGSYNPPTNMHLRMFEIARDHLHRMGTHTVIGGVISPVHDAYFRKELTTSTDRCAMLKLALQSNDWIHLSTWEIRQNTWSRTCLSLQHHQNLINNVLQNSNDIEDCIENEDMEWVPECIKNNPDTSPIQIKLLCGADLLESFGIPNLWMEEDIDKIVGQHGLVVVTREGSDPNKFIYDSDILSKYMHNIFTVTEWIPNEISSTKIRRALKRGESVKYLLQDSVIEYIYKNGIYDAKSILETKLKLSYNNANDYSNIVNKYENTLLTPSPNDLTVETLNSVEITSIDVSSSVLKKNLENLSRFGKSKRALSIDSEQIREKFIRVTSDNTNQIPSSSETTYPGTEKQIITTEARELQVLEEVGLKEDTSVDSKTDLYNSVEKKAPPILKKRYVYLCDSQVSLYSSTENELEKEETTVYFEGTTRKNLHSSDNDVSIAKLEPNSSTKMANKSDITQKDDESQSSEKCESVKDVANDSTNVQSSKAKDSTSDISLIEKEQDSSCILTNEFSNDPYCLKTDSLENAPFSENIICTIDDQSKNNEETVDCHITEIKKEQANDESKPSKAENSVSHESKKREGNLEIDGKYLKSLVNSKKSPKKLRANFENRMSVLENISDRKELFENLEEWRSRSSRMRRKDKEGKNSNSESLSMKYKKYQKDDEDDEEASTVIRSSIAKKPLRRVPSVDETKQCQSIFLQSSLDFINIDVPKRSTSIKPFEINSKKSKSYESIKRNNASKLTLSQNIEISQSESVTFKSDSTSRLITTNDFDMPTEEFCSVCYLPNDPSSTEIFYTLRSNCSSPADDDSTKCDICSSWNLQVDSDVLDQSAPQESESLYETCEICGEPAAGFEENSAPPTNKVETYSLPLSIPLNKSSLRIDEGDRLLEEDHFEIENCGLQVAVSSTVIEKQIKLESDQEDEFDGNHPQQQKSEVKCPDGTLSKFQTFHVKEASVFQDTATFVPKDEVAIGKSSKRLTRKGSYAKKSNAEYRSQEKRRYASVDNLQYSRLSFKMTADKLARSKETKHMASADNIRVVRSFRSKSLRRSADNIGRYDSSGDNLDSLEENFAKEDEETEGSSSGNKSRIMNSDTIKMILTKHGIKIISEKETVL